MDMLKQSEGKINGTLETFDRAIINGYIQSLHIFWQFLFYLIKKMFCWEGRMRRIASGITGTENTRVPAQVQISWNLGVHWLFESSKRAGTKRNEAHLRVQRNRMKRGFFNDRKPYE